MSIHIVISGHKAGKTWLYEKVDQQGRKKLVATYWANIEMPDRTLFWFAVTRDSARVVFGYDTERYLPGGECPASRQGHPYMAKMQEAPRNGPCLLLYEAKDEQGYYLQGNQNIKRNSILIHAGPASSLGCFGVAGGKSGWKRFWQVIKNLSDNFENDAKFYVHVEPRPHI